MSVHPLVVGQHALVIQEHNKVVMVSGCNPSHSAQKAKVIDARDSGDHLILMVNQAILVPEMDHCLLCHMQSRMNGVEIHEAP